MFNNEKRIQVRFRKLYGIVGNDQAYSVFEDTMGPCVSSWNLDYLMELKDFMNFNEIFFLFLVDFSRGGKFEFLNILGLPHRTKGSYDFPSAFWRFFMELEPEFAIT